MALLVFHDGQLVAFAASTAHHLDIGALSPGTCGIVDAIDAYEPKGSNSKPSRCTTAVSATTRCGSCCVTIFACPTSSSAIWKHKSQPRGLAPSGSSY
jgi:hypothetical protein